MALPGIRHCGPGSKPPACSYHEGVYPRADAIARLGERMLQKGEGVDAAEALPVYIRDDVARPARPPVTGLS